MYRSAQGKMEGNAPDLHFGTSRLFDVYVVGVVYNILISCIMILKQIKVKKQ